jgi:hypothetical protein
MRGYALVCVSQHALPIDDDARSPKTTRLSFAPLSAYFAINNHAIRLGYLRVGILETRHC